MFYHTSPFALHATSETAPPVFKGSGTRVFLKPAVHIKHFAVKTYFSQGGCLNQQVPAVASEAICWLTRRAMSLNPSNGLSAPAHPHFIGYYYAHLPILIPRSRIHLRHHLCLIRAVLSVNPLRQSPFHHKVVIITVTQSSSIPWKRSPLSSRLLPIPL